MIAITNNMEHLLFGFAALSIAIISGIILGGYSRYVLRDRKLTQTFSIVAIIATIAFMVWAWIYME